VRDVAEGMPRLIAAHHHLLDAIRKRDKEAGKIWMRRHVEDWRRGFERAGNSLDRPVERMYMEHALVTQKRFGA
jgi:GntR family transcriptional regulator, transcriptional repressor for pyruvate dehydrogenase complex